MTTFVCKICGAEIRGTFERVDARADTELTRRPDGSIAYEHTGAGTEVFWDGMLTQKREGKTLFLCRSGHDVTEDEIVEEALYRGVLVDF
ncbi:MAG: hypothetical protein P4M05_28200 [Bradyrhizobium sp.]|nr:hypothetical protein [Bradyrhizobium sp.]